MDKRQVVAAYRQGMLTLEECAQILGIDSLRIMGIVSDLRADPAPLKLRQESVGR